MGSMSWIHWVIVLLIVVLVFGTKKLKNMGHDLGGAVKGFKEGMKEATETEEAKADGVAQQVTAEKSEPAEQTIDVTAKETQDK